MTPKVQAVHLPEQSDHDLNEGTVMVVSGWGQLEDGGIIANELQATNPHSFRQRLQACIPTKIHYPYGMCWLSGYRTK